MMAMPIRGHHGSVSEMLARVGRAQYERFPWKERKCDPIVRELYWLWMHPMLTIYLFVVVPVAVWVTRMVEIL